MGRTNEYERMTHTQQGGREGGEMQSIYATQRLEYENRWVERQETNGSFGGGSILSKFETAPKEGFLHNWGWW